MPQSPYLSTDPNAGQTEGYLSTDPNAGMEPVASHGTSGASGTGIERLDRLIEEHPSFMGLVQSAESGGLSGPAPELVSGAIKKGAERIYSGLLKPAKAVRESFPGVVKTALKERVPISAGGLSKITDRMAKSRQTAMGMVKDAEAIGTPGVTGQQAVSEFPEVVKELRKRADIGQPNELARVGQRGKALFRTANRGPDIPLTRAQELKETAQEAASGAYRQIERGGSKQLSADDLLDKATATGLRKGIESRVPGIGAQNARTQELLGVTRALEDATAREANNLGIGGMRDLIAAGAGGALGGAAGGIPGAAGGAGAGLLIRMLSTPSMGSRMAIGANEIARLPIDELIRMAQLQSLRGHE